MRQLGISIYPGHSDHQKNLAYIKMAAGYGFKRIFTCLLSVDGDKEKIVGEFKESIALANSLNMQVVADVAPRVFRDLGITYDNLSFFADLNLYGIRLDETFTGREEAAMSFNPYNLKIELNMSNNVPYLDTIMAYKPDVHNLLGCHNFYPHGYSGLGRAFFDQCNRRFKKQGLTTAAFVTSHTATFGPWPVDDGLCTLEEHRRLPIEVQAKDLFLSGIDVVIISNCYASEAELKLLSSLNKSLVELRMIPTPNLPPVEQSIIFDELHFNRGDISDNLIRSTQPRVKHKGHKFEVINPKNIEKGDIIIESSLYGHYAGELQIARTAMPNSGKSSVVGKIDPADLIFIDKIEPWQKFKLIKAD